MTITKEVGAKMGMVPNPGTRQELLRNLHLSMIYQKYQSEIYNC